MRSQQGVNYFLDCIDPLWRCSMYNKLKYWHLFKRNRKLIREINFSLLWFLELTDFWWRNNKNFRTFLSYLLADLFNDITIAQINIIWVIISLHISENDCKQFLANESSSQCMSYQGTLRNFSAEDYFSTEGIVSVLWYTVFRRNIYIFFGKQRVSPWIFCLTGGASFGSSRLVQTAISLWSLVDNSDNTSALNINVNEKWIPKRKDFIFTPTCRCSFFSGINFAGISKCKEVQLYAHRIDVSLNEGIHWVFIFDLSHIFDDKGNQALIFVWWVHFKYGGDYQSAFMRYYLRL